MTAPLTTSLAAIRDKSPCVDGCQKLLSHLGKLAADDQLLEIETVLDACGMEDCLWVIDKCVDPHICRLFAADCAERVLPLFERERPNDDRPRKAIAAARAAAADATWDAAWDAARAATWDAALDTARAAGAAARAAARAAAWAAAWDAAWTDAWAATWAATWAAARAAEGDAAGDAEMRQQCDRLLQYCRHGEAAAQMPWPSEVTT